MVGSSATSFHMESLAQRVTVQNMLKEREIHARTQRRDYSHVFRKKTTIEMLRLAIIGMAIEFAYAAETAFGSPILLQTGIPHEFMSMVWGLSPIIGFFFAPLLGSLSDRCKLRWGRRRPIITILAVGVLIGLTLVSYGKDIGDLLTNNENNNNNNISENINSTTTSKLDSNDQNTQSNKSNLVNYGAIFTIIGMVLLDLGADTLQTPARTYMLDMCTPDEQSRGLTAFTLLAGIGGTFGYALGGIDWSTMVIGEFFGGNIHTIFLMVIIIFICCYIITITTFREIPLKMIEKDTFLLPLSNTAIQTQMNLQNNTEKNANNTQPLENGNYAAVDNSEVAEKIIKTTLGQYLKSIFVMPPSMSILALTNLICWMAHVTYCLYFTDFVGEAVFGGNPNGEVEAVVLYDEGVRFGCFGMSVYALSCSIYSIIINKLLKWFGTKWVFIISIMYHGIGMFVLALIPTKWAVILFSTSAGVLYGTLFTIPYILVANYHAKDCFSIRNGETVPLKQVRGLGTDVAIISSMVFIAQFIVSFCVGPWVLKYFQIQGIIYLSSIFGFMAAFSALFVFYI